MSDSLATVFKTPEDQRLAAQLGFHVPAELKPKPVKPLGHEEKTNVVGYFNPNPWPLHVSIGVLGIAFELSQKGDYVMLEVGGKRVKVNDPILEDYVRPMGLAREVAREKKVPVVSFPKAKLRESTQNSVHEAKEFVKGSDGRTQAVIKPIAHVIPVNAEQIQMPAPGEAGPVLGMSREMAEKLRLIKPVNQIRDSGPDEKGSPMDGKDLPHIEYAEDMNPKQTAEYRKLVAAQRAQAAAKTQAQLDAAPAMIPTAAVPAETPPATDGIPLEEIAESPEQLAQLQAMVRSADVDLSKLTDVAKLLPQEAPAVITESESLPDPDLPEPSIVGGPAEPESLSTSNQSAIRFKCPVCADVGYPFRSGLDRHVRTKHAEQYDAIMNSIPVTRKR